MAIEYLLTDDGIYIVPLRLRVSPDDESYQDVVEICKDANATKKDIEWVNPELSYISDKISLLQMNKSLDVSFDGQFFKVPDKFTNAYRSVLRNRYANFKKEYFAKFLYKCLSNLNFYEDELLVKLAKFPFLFDKNGDIYVLSVLEDYDYKGAGKSYFNSVPIKKLNDTVYSVVKTDPSKIDSEFMADGFVTTSIEEIYLKSKISSLLNCSYINEDRLNKYYTMFILKVEIIDNKISFVSISNMIKDFQTDKEVPKKLKQYILRSLEKIKNWDENEILERLLDYVIKLCQY